MEMTHEDDGTPPRNLPQLIEEFNLSGDEIDPGAKLVAAAIIDLAWVIRIELERIRLQLRN